MISLLAVRDRIASGRSTSAREVAVSRERVAARDGEVRAFVRLADEGPVAEAGPLAGIAVGVKDIVDTADMATEMGSPIYAGWRPKADAAIVARLRALGATVVGKTATAPFAYVDPPATRNPANLAHTPGGSSSGSAAAVAAGMVPLAIGTQTGGSIIRPASFCGCAGMKPSFRLLPTVGVKTYSWTLDTVGLFAAGVADLRLGLALLSGREMAAPRDRPVRFGLVRQDFAGERDPESDAALATAAAALERAGYPVREVAAPEAVVAGWEAHGTVQGFESAQALAWEYRTERDRLPPLLRAELDRAAGITADAYDGARRAANRARRDGAALFADVDALLTHAAPGPAPRGLDSTGQARFNRLWTLLGTPCINVPGLASAAGLPIGIQVIAPFGRDAGALAAASALEDALAAA